MWLPSNSLVAPHTRRVSRNTIQYYHYFKNCVAPHTRRVSRNPDEMLQMVGPEGVAPHTRRVSRNLSKIPYLLPTDLSRLTRGA